MLGYWSFPYSTGHWRMEENQTLPAHHLTNTQTMGQLELSSWETPPSVDIIPDRCPGSSGLLWAPSARHLFEFLFAAPQAGKSPWLNAEPWLAAYYRPGLNCLNPQPPAWYCLLEQLRLWIQNINFLGCKSTYGRSNHPIRNKNGKKQWILVQVRHIQIASELKAERDYGLL